MLDTYKDSDSAVMETVILTKKVLFSGVIVFMSNMSGYY